MTFSHTYWMLVLLEMTMVFNSIAAQLVITNNPDNQTICVGNTTVMTCGYNSSFVLIPLARINGTSHSFNNPPIAGLPLQFITPNNDTNATRIIIGPVGEQFIGLANFLCSFVLSPPVESTTAALTVVGPPNSPTIRDQDVRLDRFTISWTVASDVNNVCGPVMYNVTLDNVTNTTSMTNITYSGLNHTTNYTVVVIPYNNAGPGTPANITVTTLTPSVPFPPTDVRLSLKFVNGDVNITATWTAPQLALNMTEIQNYNLILTINSTMYNATVPANNTTVEVFAVFQNVNRTAFTNYSLSVAAVNSIGPSNFTTSVSVVSNYIEEVSVVEAVENITVLCSLAQSEPPLICQAVFYCADNETTTLNFSSAAVQNFTTSQSCNVTVQVVSPIDVSRVLQGVAFYNVSPSVQPTSPPSTSPSPSPPNRESNRSNDDDNSAAIIAGVVVAVILIAAIVIVAAILILLYYRHHRKGSHKPSSLHCNNSSGDETMKPIESDSRDGSSPSQNSTDSPGSTDPIIPPYSTVQVTNYTDNRNGIQVETSIVSQYSQVSDDKNSTANGDVTKSLQVDNHKETPQYSMVHKPTKAEGKVDNYTELADFSPYPLKKIETERVVYTDVIPSNLASHPQYSNMEHHHYGNGSTPHSPINNQAQYLTIRN